MTGSSSRRTPSERDFVEVRVDDELGEGGGVTRVVGAFAAWEDPEPQDGAQSVLGQWIVWGIGLCPPENTVRDSRTALGSSHATWPITTSRSMRTSRRSTSS